jgi:selenide, water dikinase
VTTTALKQEKADEQDVIEAVDWMKRLNNRASRMAQAFGLRGGTDVTGYGLLGHGLEVAEASNVSLRLTLADIPFISGARKYAEQGIFPGGAFDNKKHFESKIVFADSIGEPDRMLLFDPQTSGGLLLGVPHEHLDSFITRAREMGQAAWVIGSVHEGTGIEVSS